MGLDKAKMKKTLTKLFENGGDIDGTIDVLDKYGEKFGIVDSISAGMFMSQVREEVGSKLIPDISENLNYSSSALPKIFKKFRENPIWCEMYGRNDEHKANRIAIANIAYADRMGNAGPESGDGNLYKGTAALQITGKHTYAAVQRQMDELVPEAKVNLMDGIQGTIEGILASLGYWKMRGLDEYTKSFVNGEIDSTMAMNKITEKINKHTKSYDKRVAHFDSIASMLV